MLLYRLSVYSRSAIFFKEINGDLHECVRQEAADIEQSGSFRKS
jgi:hypothetical protein